MSDSTPDDPFATRPSLPPASAPSAAPSRPAEADGQPPPAVPPVVRFRILRPHAGGGLGDVLVARDAELNREVALKQIKPKYANDPDSQGRFLLEAEITGGLEHPSIVPVYGMGQYADGRPYYAMRFIRGESLKGAIEHFHKLDGPGRDPGERSLELRNLLNRFVAVCHALAYAHSRGVVHRDLKPDNIMIGKYGETLVVDWGLAKPLDAPPEPERPMQPGEGTLRPASASYASQTLVGSAIGTPHYMSPEQAAGKLNEIGPASDVYSLGATLYTLLTAAPPVPDGDVATVLRKVQAGEIVPPRQRKADVPPPLDAICRKAMALRPADRYGTASALAEDVEHWLADEPVSAWREPWTVRVRRWISRHRLLVTGLASAVMVATISLAIATVLLTAANERERAARQLAEHNFGLAKAAVDRYHTDVSESVLLHEPGMEPLRKQLLAAAEEFYTRFVRERGADPALRAELGKALYRLAQITGDIGSQKEAIALHQQALETFAALPAAEAETPEIEAERARSLHHLGRLYRLTEQPAKSEESYQQALAIWGTLTAADPGDERLQAEQARSQLGLGSVYQVKRRLDDAAALYDQSLATRERLAKAHPGVAVYQRDTAVSFSNRARVYDLQGEENDAQKAYGAAQAYQERLVEAHPHISQYEDDLATTHFNVGNLYVRAHEVAGAEGSFQKAAGIWTKIVDQHPSVTEYNAKLAECHAELARVYSARGETAKAEAAAKQARALAQRIAAAHDGQPMYEGDVAMRTVQLGDVYRAANQGKVAVAAYQEAIAILDRVARAAPGIPQHRADLARVYNSLGLLYSSPANLAKAKAALQQSLAIWEGLANDYQGEPEYLLGASIAAQNLGKLLSPSDVPAALEWCSRSIRILDALRPEQRLAAPVQVALSHAYRVRARTYAFAKRYSDSLPDWDRAVELASAADRLDLRIQRALILAFAGKHAQASAEADALAARPKDLKTSENLYRLGRVYAVAASTAATDGQLTATDRSASADRYAARAVELLQQAQAGGAFSTPSSGKRLDQDTTLNLLRDRADYRRLREQLDAKK